MYFEKNSTNPFINIPEETTETEKYNTLRNLSREEAILIKRLDDSYGFGNLKLTDDEYVDDDHNQDHNQGKVSEFVPSEFNFSNFSTPKPKRTNKTVSVPISPVQINSNSEMSVDSEKVQMKTSDFGSSGSEIHSSHHSQNLSYSSSDSENEKMPFERLDQLTAMMSN